MNKNISVWRGASTPPTNYHLWLRDEADLWFKPIGENEWRSITATERFNNLENIVFKDNTTISISASKTLIDKSVSTDVTVTLSSNFKKGDEQPLLYINDELTNKVTVSLSDTTTFKGKAVYSFGELTTSVTVNAVYKSYIVVSNKDVSESDLLNGFLKTSMKGYEIDLNVGIGQSLYLVVPFAVTTSYNLLGDTHAFSITSPANKKFNEINYYVYTVVSNSKSSGNFKVILN